MKHFLLLSLLLLFCGVTQSQEQEVVVIDGVTFSADQKTLIKYPMDKAGKEYVVPEGTEKIAEKAFWGNYQYLKILTLPISLKELGDYALAGSGLIMITWNTYPKVVGMGIWGYHDAGQSQLSSFCATENSTNCISIDGVLFSKDQKKLLGFPPAKIGDRVSGKYVVPEGTEIIGKEAFSSADISEVTLPSTLTKIEKCAFQVTALVPTGNYRTIYSLFRVTCQATTPPEVIGNPFIEPEYIDLYVPEESFEAYYYAPGWKEFRTINGKRPASIDQTSLSNINARVEDQVLIVTSDKNVAKIKLFDQEGKIVLDKCIGMNSCCIRLNHLSQKLLLLEVVYDDSMSQVFKLYK